MEGTHMILDRLQTFSGGLGGATSPLDAPTTGTQAAPNVLDYGILSGIPSSASGGGARDMGIGDKPALKLSAVVAVAFLGGTSLQLELAGAPDNGSGGEGSYTVMWLGPAVTLANLDQGQNLGDIDLPRPVPGQVLPRFLRLRYITVGTFTAGQIETQFVLDRDDQIVGPDGQYSGYPAGINVAN